MKISICQIYVKPGVGFPFSHLMQRWLGEELSSLAGSSSDFAKKFGSRFSLNIYVSADTQIVSNQIKGPTIFKKTKDVECTVFLPYDVIVPAPEGCRVAVESLLDGIRCVFKQVGIDIKKLDERRAIIIEHICSDPTMLSGPWPDR